MGNVLVLYDSKTGNTAKMAEYVAEGAGWVEGSDVRLLNVKDAAKEDILWADGLAVGSPTNLGLVSWPMKKFWDELSNQIWGQVDGKIGCAFSSQGGWGGGAEIANLSILTLLMNYGFLVFGVTDYTGHQFTLHYGTTVAGEPRSEVEKAACQRLGTRLAEWVAFYIDRRVEAHPRQIQT